MAQPSRGPPPDAKNPETRLIAEYVRDKFPDYRVMLRQPLGPPQPGSEALGTFSERLRLSRPWRPEVDAVVVFGQVLLLIEAKMAEYLEGMGKLPIYAALVDETPELAPYAGLEVRTRLVIPRPQTWVLDAGRKVGIEIDVYWQPWMEAYFAWRDAYQSREHRLERAALKAARERLGL